MAKQGRWPAAEEFVGEMPPEDDLEPYAPARKSKSRATGRPRGRPPKGMRVADRLALPDPVPPMRVTLTQRHTINGEAYGPGVVSVPPPIGQTLLEQEQRASATEENFHAKNAYVVDRYLRKIPVAPERFDSMLFSDQFMTRI